MCCAALYMGLFVKSETVAPRQALASNSREKPPNRIRHSSPLSEYRPVCRDTLSSPHTLFRCWFDAMRCWARLHRCFVHCMANKRGTVVRRR